MALMVASVPELTIRTMSMEGTMSTTFRAISTSSLRRNAVGSPVHGRGLHRSDDLRVGVSDNHRTPGAHIVDVLIAIGIDQTAPCGRHGKMGLTPTARPDRTGLFTPPGIQRHASS